MLKALLSFRNRPFDPEALDSSDPYVDRILPLNQVPDDLCPWRDKDVKAWRSLAKVPKMSPRAAQAVVRSLLSTVVEPGLHLDDPGEITFGSSAIDLRPSLCHPAGEERLLAMVGAAQGVGSELPTWHWSNRQEIAGFAPSFRYYFLWRLSLASWEQVELVAAMHESLQLAEQQPLCRAVARLFAATKGDSALWWCDAIADAPVEFRVRATELVLVAGAQERRPTEESRLRMQRSDGDALLEILQEEGSS